MTAIPLILVVEDDPRQRLFAGLALQKSGYEVVDAVDGIQGLQMARTRKPDLIVSDIMMPGMDGFQFVKAVREDAGICGIPILMVTGQTARADMRHAMTSGADDYITKPYTIQELGEAVAALLAKHDSQRDSLLNSIQAEVVAALEDQKQDLAYQYERRLMEELNKRWEQGEQANTELKYPDATVLVVNLFGSVLNRLPSGPGRADLVRRAYQAARDTLYLFGAQHLLAYGNDLLAIFAETADPVGVSAKLKAARAAFTLVKSISPLLKNALPAGGTEPVATANSSDITVALHQGPITLLHVSDPLHGDPDATLATGEPLTVIESLRGFAQSAHWRVAASQAFAKSIAPQLKTGRNAAIALGDSQPPLEAVELLGLA